MTAEPVFGFAEPQFPPQVALRLDPSLAGRPPLGAPIRPNTWSASGDRDALWLGPDEWLVVGPPGGSAAGIVADLDRALDGVHRSVVDVSANRAAIDLSGRDRLEVLSKGCGLDLDRRAWREGMCAQTLLARVPVLLQERHPGTRVFVRPSYLAYLTAWLDDASR